MDEPDDPTPRETVHDPESETYTTGHDWDTPDDPSNTVVEAVATVTGTDPLELRPLYDVIDLDGLDRLFRPERDATDRRTAGSIRFQYEGCEVTVEAAGRTHVRQTDGNWD